MRACIECGNDDPCEGYEVCSDCLEMYGDEITSPATAPPVQ